MSPEPGAYCYQCHHAWMAHDDGTDDGDYCRVCPCDGFVSDGDDGGPYFVIPDSGRFIVRCNLCDHEWPDECALTNCGCGHDEREAEHGALESWAQFELPGGAA